MAVRKTIICDFCEKVLEGAAKTLYMHRSVTKKSTSYYYNRSYRTTENKKLDLCETCAGKLPLTMQEWAWPKPKEKALKGKDGTRKNSQ